MIHAIPNVIVEWVSLILPAVSSMVFLTKELFHLAQSSLGDKKLKLVAGIMGMLHMAFIIMLKMWFL
jgi:hypothetical protein